MDEQKTPLTHAQIRTAGEAGGKAAIERWEAARRALQEASRDRRFRNIKVLLQNYTIFKAAAESAIYTAEQAEQEDDLVLLMWDPANKAEAIVESIRRSALNTLVTVAHIDAMLACYQRYVAQRGEVAQRRYNILHDRFLIEEPLSMEDICKKYFIEQRTVYDDIEEAVKTAALFMFGVEFLIYP